MNDDTSSTPDESDGRVATDRTDEGEPARRRTPPRPKAKTPAASSGSGPTNGAGGSSAHEEGADGEGVAGVRAARRLPDDGPAEATPPAPASSADGRLAAGDRTERTAMASDAPVSMPNGRPEPRRAPPPVTPAAGFEATPHPSPTPVARNGGAPPELVKQDEEAPTATLRVAPTNGSPSSSAVGTNPGRASVPAAGSATAGPPPWNRVPGQEPQPPSDERTEVVPHPRPAGGLLDADGPTEFLEAPDRSNEGKKGEGTSRSGGWASGRSVRGRPPRQAALQLRRLDPWSVLKLALVLAVVLFLMWLVAVGVLYGVLDGIGVWDRLNGTYADLVSGEAQSGSPLISAGRVFGLAAVVGAINSLLFAVALTVGAFVYNVSADLVGGIEVTLSERD